MGKAQGGAYTTYPTVVKHKPAPTLKEILGKGIDTIQNPNRAQRRAAAKQEKRG